MTGEFRRGLRAACVVRRLVDARTLLAPGNRTTASFCRAPRARIALGCAAMLIVATSTAYAEDTTDATSHHAARDEALRAIPWKSLEPAQRQRVEFVVRNASIYRRLPTRVIDCDPDLFSFLLRHPDIVVNVWQLMGISKASLERMADESYRGSDGNGTTGRVEYLHADWGQDAQNLAVVYAEGAYDGKPFIAPLQAETVLVLRSAAFQETNGRHYITVRVDSFVHIDQMGLELVARTVQPWLNRMADQNFVETLGFVSTFSRTAEKNPQGMQRLAARLREVDEPTRNELVQLCYRAAQRYSQDDSSRWSQPYMLAQRTAAPQVPAN
jgi:hypothetical protein